MFVCVVLLLLFVFVNGVSCRTIVIEAESEAGMDGDNENYVVPELFPKETGVSDE